MRKLLVFLFLAPIACSEKKYNVGFLTSTDEIKNKNYHLSVAGPTGSMRPLINDYDIVVLGPVDEIKIGDILVFDRGDYPNVIHAVAELNSESIYMSGINNRISDGWFDKKKVKWKCYYIIKNRR